jgi:hypothetical protein
MKNCIITQAKDQADRLTDWILYHYEQGFDTFLYFDDYSEDNSIEILNSLKEKYGINIIINYSDKVGDTINKDYMNNANFYGGNISVNYRIIRSYNQGFKIINSINPDAICAVIDVDEFLVSNNDEKIVDIIDSVIHENSHLYIHSFDVNDNFILENWYTTQEVTKYRWDFESRKNTHFINRGKSVCKANYITEIPQGPNYVHILKDVTNNVSVDNFELLRIHHFRKPILDTTITMIEDLNLINKMKKIKEKY